MVGGRAVAHEIPPRRDKPAEWRIDVVEIDISDEAVDGGVDTTGRPRSVDIAVRRHGVGQNLQVGEAERVAARCF